MEEFIGYLYGIVILIIFLVFIISVLYYFIGTKLKIIINKMNNEHLILKFKNILKDNDITNDKIFFSEVPCFTYDTENNIIGSNSDTSKNKLYMMSTYQGKINELKDKFNNSKLGIVFWLNKDNFKNDRIRFIDLDIKY